MPRVGGYAVWTGKDGKVVERDTFTCGHCNTVHVLEPKQPPPGGCRMCMKNICEPCVVKGTCTPFEKKLEKVESRDRMLRQMGIGG